jgi:phage-related minor tail protein
VADNSWGLKIGIEGEKEFKNALKEINQSFKVLGSEMNLVTSQFDKQDKSLQAITARNAVLNKEIDAQKNKISTLEAALKNASDSFGETDRRTQNWAIQLNNAKADLNKMEKELDNNNQALHEMEQGFDEAEEGAGRFADSVNQAAKQTEDASGKFEKLGGVLKGIGAAIAATVVALGSAAIATGASLIKLGDEYNMAVNQISASTGATGQELEALGEVAQNVYKHNFGDSLEDVANGISEVSRTTGLMGQELEKATESGFALRDTFGFEMQESARAAGALIKNFGISADEAYNIIAVGAQNGADKNGDLLDTLNEYSAQYAALGA